MRVEAFIVKITTVVTHCLSTTSTKEKAVDVTTDATSTGGALEWSRANFQAGGLDATWFEEEKVTGFILAAPWKLVNV